MTERPSPRPLLRIANAILFGAFAAVGFGLVARPALLFWKSLGMFSPVLPWSVPLGQVFFLVALCLILETLRLGLALTSGRRLRALDRVLLLALLAAAVTVRATTGEPLPPASPTPRLISAVRTAADALDQEFLAKKTYAPEVPAIDAQLTALGGSYFVYRGREAPLHVRVLESARGAQTAPLQGDLPGTIYLALSGDRMRASISALTLDAAGKPDILRTPGNKALLIEARAGTHSAPGRDPLMPEYPGMQSAIKKPGATPGSSAPNLP